MDLSLLYTLINVDNFFIFILGFMAGFGAGRALFKQTKKAESYERIGGACIWSYKLKGERVGLHRMYKNGKKIGIDCCYLQSRSVFKKPFCSLLECPCKDF